MLKEIIEELNANNSSNYKLEVLKKYKDNKELEKVLLYTYNKDWNYYIKKIPNYIPEDNNISYLTIDDMFITLDKLKSREVTGNSAIDLLDLTLTRLPKDLSYILELIIGRDIKCGISSKSINKVFKYLIPETPYQRCEKKTEKTLKNIPFFGSNKQICQLKADGVFTYIIKENGNVYLKTRNGSTTTSETVSDILSDIELDNFVLMGEALIEVDGKVQDRKTGNGKVLSYFKRFDTLDSLQQKYESSRKDKDLEKYNLKLQEFKDIEKGLRFDVWDIISLDEFKKEVSFTPYKDRLENLNSLVNNLNTYIIKVIDTHYVTSVDEAEIIAINYQKQGLEGAILKDIESIWENKTSKKQIKFKAINDADLLCVGVEEGNGKNTGKVGALVLESKCKKLKVNVGSGLNGKQIELPFDYFIGKVIEVKYNEVIYSKGKEEASLFLPIFVEVREDKDDYNLLKDLK